MAGYHAWTVRIALLFVPLALAGGCSSKSTETQSLPPVADAPPDADTPEPARLAPPPMPDAMPTKSIDRPQVRMLATPEPEAPQEPAYAVVEVYYATDRARLDDASQGAAPNAAWAALGAMVVLGAIVTAWLLRRPGKRIVRVLLGTTGIAACMIAMAAAYVWLDQRATAPVDAPSRAYYGAARGALELGACTVSIPRDHRMGELESPSILRFEVRYDPEKHVTLLSVDPQPADEFYRAMQAGVARSSSKSAFVFVHGYNVTFDDAVRRTAQIAHDLGFDGVPIAYSWPSQGKLPAYTIDENNVEWTVPHLEQFLVDVAERSGAEHVHLVAHSMGNRALTSALRLLAYKNPSQRPLFNEVLLTAPDIDADVFRRDIVPTITKTARRVTLYASSNDEALALSKQVHGYPRAGDTGLNLVVVPGIDTIDVSAVDTSLLGHAYYASNDTVLADIFDLLHAATPPDKRRWLRGELLGTLRYWVFDRQ
jgi:esterase/lipase superfamily enzyme